jgi:hypothetical protein
VEIGVHAAYTTQEPCMTKAGNPFSREVELPDKRTVTVRLYDNGEIGIEVTASPYVLSECKLPPEGQLTELKLSPGKQGSKVPVTKFKVF